MTISVVSEKQHNPIRVILAWSVHFFTATGAVWGFLALRAVFDHDWREMIIWIIVANVRGWIRWDAGALGGCNDLC